MTPISLSRELFDDLASRRGEPLISVLLPAHVKGAEIAQDRIRLKNGISTADRLLEEAGWRTRDRERHLEQARDLLDDREFWEHQSQGLGVFVEEDSKVRAVALSEPVPEPVQVGEVFLLRHALQSLETITRDVLVLTMAAVRLYRADRYEINPVEADLPGSFEDVNWFVDREKQRQQHPDAAGSKRARHGHEPSDRRGEDLNRFLRAVAEALPRDQDTDPLIVLGTDNLVSRFRRIHEKVVSPEQPGITEVDDLRQIHEKAASVIDAERRAVEQARLEAASEALGAGTAVTDLEAGLHGAVMGRFARVVLSRSTSARWGRFDETTLEMTETDAQGYGDVDLLDRLAVLALSTGAEVVTIEDAIDGHDFVGIPRF